MICCLKALIVYSHNHALPSPPTRYAYIVNRLHALPPNAVLVATTNEVFALPNQKGFHALVRGLKGRPHRAEGDVRESSGPLERDFFMIIACPIAPHLVIILSPGSFVLNAKCEICLKFNTTAAPLLNSTPALLRFPRPDRTPSSRT